MSLVKSRKRVADHGEVFTPPWLVNAMLDLVKGETERIDARFLEPACGNGNFLVEILRRKLAAEGLFETARWIAAADPADLRKFMDANKGNMAEDRDGAPVFLAKSGWELGYIADRNPAIRFTATKERG